MLSQGDESAEGCGILVDAVLQGNVDALKVLAALGPESHPLRDIDGMLVWESPASVGEVSKVLFDLNFIHFSKECIYSRFSVRGGSETS